LIIKEFDSDEDGNLNYNEFCQIVLPSTNYNLRRIAEGRRESYRFRPEEPLSKEAQELLGGLLEKEIGFIKKREEIKRALLQRDDFNCRKAFEELCEGRPSISLFSLSYFLEKNGFKATREDLEAILRRLDHDAD